MDFLKVWFVMMRKNTNNKYNLKRGHSKMEISSFLVASYSNSEKIRNPAPYVNRKEPD